jgi:hypothetical protein
LFLYLLWANVRKPMPLGRFSLFWKKNLKSWVNFPEGNCLSLRFERINKSF